MASAAGGWRIERRPAVVAPAPARVSGGQGRRRRRPGEREPEPGQDDDRGDERRGDSLSR
jgi:hypothetical protein